jgi:hypothetical protein
MITGGNVMRAFQKEWGLELLSTLAKKLGGTVEGACLLQGNLHQEMTKGKYGSQDYKVYIYIHKKHHSCF